MVLVSQASSLQSLYVPNFGARIRYAVHRRGFLYADWVKCCRDAVYYYETEGRQFKRWIEESADMLDKEGYIRHDIDKRSFLVGHLYRKVYEGDSQSKILYDSYEEVDTNEKYESFRNIPIWNIELVYEIVDGVLSKKDADLIRRRFNLEEDGKIWRYRDLGELHCISGEWARQHTKKALKKLKLYLPTPMELLEDESSPR